MSVSRVTLKDVAAACGYTVNTVSRAMRSDSRLPESTRQRIQETARQMGYIRNSLASSLRSGKSHTIAVIVNDVHNLHFCNMLSRIDQSLRRAGYNMMILCMQLNEDVGEQLIHAAISHSVDGILYFPYHNNPSHVAYMQKNEMPFVLLDRWIQGVVADNARCDDVQGGRLAGEHLAALGHRRFLFLSGVNRSSSQIDRLEGFLSAIRDCGLSEADVRIVPGEDVEAALAVGDIGPLLDPMDFTAIVSFRDEVSYLVLNALDERGVRVPQDVSIVSFDHLRADIPYLPRLTSIYAAEGSVATTGVRLLLNRIAFPELPPQIEIMPVTLYDEGTTAAPADCREAIPEKR